MSCAIEDIDRRDNCPDTAGGTDVTVLVDGKDIEDLTITGNVVSAVTLAVAGSLAFLYADKDDTSYYNSTGERPNESNNHRYNDEFFGKFDGVDPETGAKVDNLKDCCNIVAFHFLNNGTCRVQGIERIIDPPVDGKTWRFSQRQNKATINIMSGVGSENNRAEVFLKSVSKNATFCDMTVEDFEAL